MDVINKLYSSVSNTVSQLSGVLPGNPVTREFEATQYIGSAGPGLLWKIYKGYKKSTKQEASIFVFEKRVLDRWSKGDRDVMLETLRRGITQLTKLRHPQVLTVQHSLEESRESLAFATEPVFASLANILGNIDNMPLPVPPVLVNYKLFELEIKYGLLQVAEGLTFLHNDVKLMHHNICPESIVVNQQGAWKIFGFDYCIPNQNTSDPKPYWPFNEYCSAMHHLTQPSLDYLAPEYVLSASHSTASDIFSLGMLIYTLHSPNSLTLGNIQTDYDKYKRFANELRLLTPSRLNCVADGLKEYVKLMLNVTPELRPDPHQFLKIPYFEDVGVKTLNYLDSLFQWDNLQKSQFFKGLPQIIRKLPHRVCINRILPCLVKEFVNSPMIPFVLPNVLLIAENSSKEEYVKYVLPQLKAVMVIQDPIQILLIFMQKMELLLKLTPPEEIKSDVLPMLYRALESDAQQIQELCLSVLPTFASLIDYPAMKNALLPRIKKLCISTNFISVRVNCLLCIGKLLEHLDKWLVLDEVLPFLPQIPSREPAVLMGILGIYKLSLSHKKLGITKELMATKIIPFLMPLCVENGLTLNQFNSLISLVKSMMDTVETEHRAKLEQLNSIQNESKSFEQSMIASHSGNTLISAPSPQNDFDKMFDGLGIENYSSGNSSSDTSQITPGNSIPAVDGSYSNSLSIEEKKRIAQQQENVQRYSKQSPPTAIKSPPSSKSTTKSLDLTDSLLQSNVNQMNRSGPFHPTNTNYHTNKTVASPSQINSTNLGMQAKPPPMSNAWSMNQLNATLSINQSYTGFSMAHQSNFNTTLASKTGLNNSDMRYKQNTPGKQADWSAFDSLLPESQNKVPMNQLSTTALLTPTPGSTSNTNIKKLSNNDIMDFLLD